MQKLNLQILQKAFDDLTCEDKSTFLNNNIQNLWMVGYIDDGGYCMYRHYIASSKKDVILQVSKDKEYRIHMQDSRSIDTDDEDDVVDREESLEISSVGKYHKRFYQIDKYTTDEDWFEIFKSNKLNGFSYRDMNIKIKKVVLQTI